jgi:hypothetical protein
MPGGGAGGPGFPGGGAFGGGGAGGAFAGVGPKVEYQFVAKPKRTDDFKKLLTQHGNEGWEYVGVIPDGEELIFKRHQRISGFGGMGGGMGMGPMMGGGGGFGGGPGMPKGGMPPAAGAAGAGAPPGPPGLGGPPPGLPGRGGPGGAEGGPAAGGSDGAGPQLTVQLQAGETIRYKMTTLATIERVFNHDSKFADVTPDPTDARRVLIKGLQTGSGKLDLTDANGNKETHTFRVK